MDTTAKTFSVILSEKDADDSFNYIDTASSRADIVSVTQKRALKKIAIILQLEVLFISGYPGITDQHGGSRNSTRA